MLFAKWQQFCPSLHVLTHWGWVTHICISKLTIIGSDNGLSPGRRQAITLLNQCWNVHNWTLRNKLQWNINQNQDIFIQENMFENVVCKTLAILCWSHCVDLPANGKWPHNGNKLFFPWGNKHNQIRKHNFPGQAMALLITLIRWLIDYWLSKRNWRCLLLGSRQSYGN